MVDEVKDLIESSNKFIKELNKDHSRFKSWEHCFLVFNEIHKKQIDLEKEDLDFLCLNLAFYLSSWGMLRNSFLLDYDYKIHEEVVRMLFDSEYEELWNIDCSQYLNSDILSKLESLSEKISVFYKKIRNDLYKYRKEPIPKSSVSQTLVTKVLMGTMGCVPAFDENFVKAVRYYKVSSGNYNVNSIKQLSEYYKKYFKEFESLRKKVSKEIGYPQMKILDMCFWQKGFELKKENS